MTFSRIRTAFESEYVEEDLPYLLSMMTTMIKAGMDLTETLSTLQVEASFSSATRALLSSIVLESRSTPLSAVLNEKSKAYGGRIRTFLSGLAVETVKGDVGPYLESFMDKMMSEKLSEIRGGMPLEQILGIGYSVLFLLGPMIAIIVITALGYIGMPLLPLVGWFDLLFLFYVPMGTLFFTFLGWKKEPLRRAAPFLLACAALFYAGIVLVRGYLSDVLVAAAGLVFLPIGLYESQDWMREQSVDRNLPSFLRDLSLQLLSGRDFLQAFRSLAEKRYGRLSRVLQRMIGAMQLGEPFTNAVHMLAHETVFSGRVATLLTTLMRKGGEVSRIMESVSDFSWGIHTIEVEKRRRQYLTVIFFYIFMVVFLFLASSVLQIFSTITPILGGAVPTARVMTKTLFDASMISAVCTGLVVGVMTTRRIGAGGVHIFLFALMCMGFYYYVW